MDNVDLCTWQKDEILDCFDDDWKFSAQTTPEKVSEKQRN
jgi:hypothetical protein